MESTKTTSKAALLKSQLYTNYIDRPPIEAPLKCYLKNPCAANEAFSPDEVKLREKIANDYKECQKFKSKCVEAYQKEFAALLQTSGRAISPFLRDLRTTAKDHCSDPSLAMIEAYERFVQANQGEVKALERRLRGFELFISVVKEIVAIELRYKN